MPEYKSHHVPIFLKEFLDFFASHRLRRFVDATLGGAGHAEAILEAHPEIETFIGIEGDPQAIETAHKKLSRFGNKIVIMQGNFRHLKQYLKEPVDGIFFDIGLSSMQLDESDLGFSFNRDAPLDMRKDPTLDLDARMVVNTFPEQKLGEIFRELGEEKKWRQAAKIIVEERKKREINTTFDLIRCLEKVMFRRGKIHPATLIFQALRIYVNDELKSLEEGILQGIEMLNSNGRCGVITFHSLEDRIVKNIFKATSQEKKTLLLTKKPLVPTREEIRKNSRARSAKLRFVEKL